MNQYIVTSYTYNIIFCTWYFCQILNKMNFYDIFLLELSDIRFSENLSRVAWDILCAITKLRTERRKDRLRDKHDEAYSLFSQLCGLVEKCHPYTRSQLSLTSTSSNFHTNRSPGAQRSSGSLLIAWGTKRSGTIVQTFGETEISLQQTRDTFQKQASLL